VINRGRKAIKTWMFVYAGLMAVMAFTSQTRDLKFEDAAELSPVAVENGAPALKVDSLVRRADI
jgi:hypothetical protein